MVRRRKKKKAFDNVVIVVEATASRPIEKKIQLSFNHQLTILSMHFLLHFAKFETKTNSALICILACDLHVSLGITNVRSVLIYNRHNRGTFQ